MKHNANLSRMIGFFLLAAMFYAVAIILTNGNIPHPVQLETVLWKLGHATIGAFLGYWIDRHAFRARITDDSEAAHHYRRAIIIVGSMLAVAYGM